MIQKSNLEKPTYAGYDIEKEARLLRESLDSQNLYIPEDFYTKIRPGDVIDVYARWPEGKQLYRNDEFRKYSSYTDEQLQTIPFVKLMWRSEDDQKTIVARMTDVSLNSDKAESWNMENHELVEVLHPQKRTFEMDMGHVAAVFVKGTNERMGFISSQRVAAIFEWPEKV